MPVLLRHVGTRGGNNIRTLKAHTYHVLTQCGALTEVANFPRGLDDPSQVNILRLLRNYTTAHRVITKHAIDPQVYVLYSKLT